MDESEVLPELVPLVVEVWYPEVPDPTNPLLLDVLADELSHAEATSDGVIVSHEPGFHATADGDPAWANTHIGYVTARARPQRPPELASCRGALLLTEQLAGYLDPVNRVQCLKSVLEALARVTSPVGYWWPMSETVTDLIGDDDALWHGIIHVRRQQSDVDRAGWLIDTLGMEAFDMPDLECHFHGLPEDVVAEQLGERAMRMVARQEYMADGDPVIVPDEDGEDLWFTVRYAAARREPQRGVIALVADPDHALDPPEQTLDFDDED